MSLSCCSLDTDKKKSVENGDDKSHFGDLCDKHLMTLRNALEINRKMSFIKYLFILDRKP